MRRRSIGEQKAIGLLAAERLIGLRLACLQYSADPVISAMFHYFLCQMHSSGSNGPAGIWVDGGKMLPAPRISLGIFRPVRWPRGHTGQYGSRQLFIPFPQEVQPCCKEISPKCLLKYGGYWEHCLGIRHFSYKFKVPERLLHQTIYYYKKLKGYDQVKIDFFYKFGPGIK